MGAEDGLCAWDYLAPIYTDQDPLVPANAETAPAIANCIKYAEAISVQNGVQRLLSARHRPLPASMVQVTG